MVDVSVTGVALGTLYVRSGRNLWATILAHGLTDTVALAAVFTGLVKV